MKLERIEAITIDNKTAMQYAEQIAKQEIEQEIKSIKYVGGGSFGKAFRVVFSNGSKIIIKFICAKDMLDKEVYDLKVLAKNCSINFPRVLFVHKADSNISIDCYGMEHIEGCNAVFSIGLFLKSKRKRQLFADKVTTALHDIHCHTNDKFGDTLHPIYDKWLDYYKPHAQEILTKAEQLFLNGSLSKNVIMAMREAWEKFDIIFSEEIDKASLTHGDLNIANIIVDKKYHISGFIDPLNSMYADREYDLFQFDNLSGKRFNLRNTYVEKYGGSKYCNLKCAFYGLYHEVYCYITSGNLYNFIMKPLVKNMYKRLAEL